jgi:hypothetical protein
MTCLVISEKAGIQADSAACSNAGWTPAFAGAAGALHRWDLGEKQP